jgi:O-antigen ligase
MAIKIIRRDKLDKKNHFTLKNLTLGSMLGYAFFAPVSITISEIFFIITMLLFVIRAVKREINIRDFFSTPLSLPIAVFVLIHLVNAVFGVDMKSGLIDFRKAYLILAFFTAANVYTEVYPLRMGAGFFAGGAAFVGAWCVFNTITHKYVNHEAFFRAVSFSGNHMHAGGMLMMGLVTAAGIVAYRLKNENGDHTPKFLYITAMFLIALGLLGTSTRSSWIGAAAGVFMLSFMVDKKFFAVLLISAAIVAGISWNSSFMERFRDSFNLEKGNSQSERLLMWDSGLKMIHDRPLIGVGTGNVDKVYPKYISPSAIEPNAGHLHNNFIQIAVIDGLPGLAAFLWIFAAFWTEMYRGIKAAQNPVFKYVLMAALCVNAAFFINGFFEYNFFSSQVALIFWYLMGVAFAALRLEKKAITQTK